MSPLYYPSAGNNVKVEVDRCLQAPESVKMDDSEGLGEKRSTTKTNEKKKTDSLAEPERKLFRM